MASQAFANRQLQLFQGLLANSPDEREALSNTVDLWDSIPRYTVSRSRMKEIGSERPDSTVWGTSTVMSMR